ncbi:TPA: cytochrome C biogenesis protein [bacterium]|nr:cytochrome C biogenesis protein [bacterium]
MIKLSELSFIASLLAGIATFISPCVLPLIPAYISFITGASIEELKNGKGSTKHTLLSALFFVFGFSLIFILLGASATYLGALLGENRDLLRVIGGVAVILFGLHLAGALRIKFLYQERRLLLPIKRIRLGYLSPFLIGLAFALGWTPCVGPILSSILILASAQETMHEGIMLLGIYSFGLGVPFLITALAINQALGLFTQIKRFYRVIEIASGVILIIVGILLITNRFQMIIGHLVSIFL